MSEDKVILVDNYDTPIGTATKIEAHEKGLLHRAFSVFLFDEEGELYLQKRAETKYHSAGLWSNTCCSHPKLNETVLQAAHRRLQEEVGISCELKEIFSFKYFALLENKLKENEFDHVLIGTFNGTPQLNPAEVSDWKKVSIQELTQELASNPTQYTAWLKICFAELKEHLPKE